MSITIIRPILLMAFLCLVLIIAPAGMSQTDLLLKQAIISELGNPTSELKFVSKRVDLNGDGHDEVLAWVPTQDFGGTGGYPLLIFAGENNGYRLLWKHDQLWPPLIVLRSTRHGWRELVLQVGGGGAKMHYVLFSHNSKIYYEQGPINEEGFRGQWLIGKDWKMSIVGPWPD
ncbi:MAG TPA: hypothetical protein VF708_20335 [Pyrinomonadaceae bacterium]|jgi:hypothetical protein